MFNLIKNTDWYMEHLLDFSTETSCPIIGVPILIVGSLVIPMIILMDIITLPLRIIKG